MKITFLGAVGEVTGSRYLIEHQDIKILADCGLFQGSEDITKHNRDRFPIDPAHINAVVLTHAHIDHSGYIPALVKNGFKGRIYCSKGTYELCAIVLVDSGKLQEEDAKQANENKKPEDPLVKPLYTAKDAERSLRFFQVIDYDKPLSLDALKVTFIRSSHIIGATFVEISDGKKVITFSGDLGRSHRLVMKAPPHLAHTDFLVLEATYGNRLHSKGNPIELLGQYINEAVSHGGTVLIPAFAIGRTQTILYCLYTLKQMKAIPDVPIFLDSPMAIRVTKLFCHFQDDIKVDPVTCKNMFRIATFTDKAEASKQLDHLQHPSIIIAGSGMIDGGRMLYHFQHYISDPKNSVIFVGFQAEGTIGHGIVTGAKEIKLFGQSYKVNATIKTIDMFSAHADYNEILEWLGYFERAPQKVFLTHGDLEAAQSLKEKIEQRLGWSVMIPRYLDSYDLD